MKVGNANRTKAKSDPSIWTKKVYHIRVGVADNHIVLMQRCRRKIIYGKSKSEDILRLQVCGDHRGAYNARSHLYAGIHSTEIRYA